MGRYEYQENPQVLHWKEQCQALRQQLEKEREHSKAVLAGAIDEKHKLLVELYREEKRGYKKLRQQLDELKEDIALFNQLPWYEKMFFKFDT